MGYNPKDYYFKKAKEQNFAARSVFKLEEIDERFRVIKKNDIIIDLGCAPGSWAQYACKKIGTAGRVIGIDLQKVQLTIPNALFIHGDAFDVPTLDNVLAEQKIEKVNVVMSDMAPKTTGIRIQDQQRSYDLCMRALEVALLRLKPGGNFIVKFFQSEFFDDYLKEVRKHFMKVEILRPKSTRKNSIEIFIIGLGLKD